MRLAAIERLDGITANLRAGDRLRYLRSGVLPRAGSDATSAEWLDTSQVTLGLDHAQILADAKAKIFSHIRSEGHDAQADH